MEAWHWLVFGLILVIAEMFTMTFAALWFGMAAIVVSALVWMFPMAMPTWQLQALAWLIFSVISVIVWFKFVQPTWAKNKTNAGLGGGVIIGEIGMIVKKPHADRAGTIRFNVPKVGATEWQCRCAVEVENIEVGDRVIVTNILGNELVVSPMNAAHKTD